MDLKKLEEKIKEDIAFYLLDADWPFPKNIQDEFFRIITQNFTRFIIVNEETNEETDE
tara:strand:+ start:293 stop:466 length:174 start_codon:yes stop_codon:yes gene_type:complete